jgi:hypothetical protein
MKLFQQALWEATYNVYERELTLCDASAKCSRRHYVKMKKILGVAVLPATNPGAKIKRRIVAALIAAALLLTGCAAYAYREEIKEFIETIFDDHIEVKYDDNEDPTTSATITEYYTLGYVPEGYDFIKIIEQPTQIKSKWVNAEGKYILLVQCTVESALFIMDTETEDWNLIQLGDHEIYYRSTGVNYYIWNDGKYAYQLILSASFHEQELISMIENIRMQE